MERGGPEEGTESLKSNHFFFRVHKRRKGEECRQECVCQARIETHHLVQTANTAQQSGSSPIWQDRGIVLAFSVTSRRKKKDEARPTLDTSVVIDILQYS